MKNSTSIRDIYPDLPHVLNYNFKRIRKKTSIVMVTLMLTSLSIAQIDLGGSNGNGSSFLGTQNNEPLRFYTNANERMRLTTSGKLGIGMTDPTRTLDVNGDVGFNGALYLTNLDSTSTSNQITTSTNYFLSLNNSKVVKTSIEDLRALMYSPAPYDPPGFSACDLAGNPIQQNPAWSNEPFKLYTLCDDILIGIGTSSPQYNLDVNGDGNFRGTLHTRQLKLGVESPGNALINGYWKGSNTSQMLLNIGFISNQAQTTYQILTLDVNGNLRLKNKERDIFYIDADTETVRARNIIVDEQNWPDYVFNKEYTLLSLYEVKAYIEKNGHLPNVPSAREVEEHGLSLGGMTKVTMEKVEELTLYLLQMNEKLEQQEANLVELQNLIDEQAKLIQIQQMLIEQLKVDNK